MIVLGLSVLAISGWVYDPVRQWANILPYHRYAKAHPTDPEPTRLLAAQYGIRRDSDKALEIYMRFIRNNPDNFELHREVALTLYGRYKMQKAPRRPLETWEHGLELLKEVVRYARLYVEYHPSDVSGYVTLGEALVELGRSSEGNRYLQRAIELVREDVQSKAEEEEEYIKSLMKSD